jgi:hypothetical protein
MEANLKLECPDEVEMSLTLNGTVGEFRMLDSLIREMNSQCASTNLWRRPLSTLLESIQMGMTQAQQNFRFKEPA